MQSDRTRWTCVTFIVNWLGWRKGNAVFSFVGSFVPQNINSAVHCKMSLCFAIQFLLLQLFSFSYFISFSYFPYSSSILSLALSTCPFSTLWHALFTFPLCHWTALCNLWPLHAWQYKCWILQTSQKWLVRGCRLRSSASDCEQVAGVSQRNDENSVCKPAGIIWPPEREGPVCDGIRRHIDGHKKVTPIINSQYRSGS